MQIAAGRVAGGRPFVPHHRFVDPRPMDIAPQDGARAAILRHELVPVIEEPGRSRRAGHLVEPPQRIVAKRSEEHTSELQSLMRISYAVFCLKKKTKRNTTHIELSKEHTR